MRETRCLNCKCIMTLAEQKRLFGRVLRCGLSVHEAKEAQPRCQKCMTLFLGGSPVVVSPRRVRSV